MNGQVARVVQTPRLATNVLEVDGRRGEAVVFVHGNVSSAVFWQQSMADLPPHYRPLAPDLRGFGGSEPAPVDATRGVDDFADDLASLLDTLELDRAHLVGWSLGGGVVLRYLCLHPERVRSLTLVNPVSPFGFGGTTGLDGRPCWPDAAGSGGGGVNAEFLRRLATRDPDRESPLSPYQVLLGHYVKPPFVPEHAEEFVASMLATHLGEDNYPGDSIATDNWPGIAPGTRGVLNTLSPKYFRIPTLAGVTPSPPVLWVRGSHDVIVSDNSLYDFGQLGALGVVPGWPGAEVFGTQPMVGQTRAVLDTYPGGYRELVFADTGHGPHLEKPGEFRDALVELFGSA